MKIIGNWTSDQVAIAQNEDGAVAVHEIPPMSSLAIPVSDEEVEMRKEAAVSASAVNATDAAASAAADWVDLRRKRDRWLAQTDAFFIDPLPTDFPTDLAGALAANREAWATFRQTLRDLPGSTSDPSAAVWPAPPPAPIVYLT